MKCNHLSQNKEFWKRILGAPFRLLGLDYDGTLAPFHVNRMQAFPLAGIIDRIQAIAKKPDTEVAIVSGRPVSELLSLLGNLEIRMVGSHGWEERSVDGALVRHQPTPVQKDALTKAHTLASQLGLKTYLEQKIASLALHTRSMQAEKAQTTEYKIHQAWSIIAESCGMQCRSFNGGVELRATGKDKATAMKNILDGLPQGTCPVYVGDDDTDEDAFALVADVGIGIRVSKATKETKATAFLPDPEAVSDFLSEWLRQAEQKIDYT